MVDEHVQNDPQGTQSPGQDPSQTPQEAKDAAAKELGFNSWDALCKSHKEQHATLTKLFQERSDWEREREELAALVGQRGSQPQYDPYAQYDQSQGQGQNWNAQDPAAIAYRAAHQAIAERDVHAALKDESPARQRKLRQLMLEELSANPHLERQSNAVDKLLERAKAREKQEQEDLARSLFGEGASFDKLRALLNEGSTTEPQAQPTQQDRLQAGFMPDSGPPSGGTGQNKSTWEERERKRYEKAMQDGDAHSVADFVFRDTKNIMTGDGRKIK